MAVKLIYAATEDRVIGSKGKLPWHLPSDLKRFQQKTTGQVVVMGSGTYFSLPGKKRPLKDRLNIVLTRNPSLKLHGVTISQSLNSVISDYNDRDIYIIGGGEVLKHAINFADEIHLTSILNKIVGDTVSPIIDPAVWQVVSQSEVMEENGIRYRYIDYKRKSK